MKSPARGGGVGISPKKNAATRGGERRFSPLWLPALLTLIFAGFTLLPRVDENPNLKASFLAAAGFLLAGLCFLWWSVARTGRTLTYEFVPRRVHWVQLIMHSCVYAYWGWYWREVYHELPVIAAQVFFLYVVDMLVCWSRRDNWILGFGPIPIIFSMNLFLWFRDDWFYLQFVMVAIIVLGKEFLRWKRDGHLTHIFNPSAFALFLTSIVLLATRSTPITWGPQISATFNNPPNIYLEIFLLGLVVQGLFSVTLVTLSAAAMLFVLDVVYLGSTGMYQFIDFNIHPAVFLGLHLLVTDPATSPRKNFGKAIFGAGYGVGVFVLYGLLDSLGAPTFYDKLLCVPALNLTVRALDRASIALSTWLARQRWFAGVPPLHALSAWTPQQANFGFMGIWVALFGFMIVTGFLGGKHPGGDPAFWERACETGHTKACRVQAQTLDVQCQGNSASGCFTLGMLLSDGKRLPRDPIGATRSFTHACNLGSESACSNVVSLVKTDGDSVLLQPCNRGDGESCLMLGSLYYDGHAVSRNLEYSASLFQQSCAAGLTRGCGQLGESYFFGEGVPKDIVKASRLFEGLPRDPISAARSFTHDCGLGIESACSNVVNLVKTGGDGVLLQPCSHGDGESCFMLGSLYYGGQGVSRNLEYSAILFEQSCRAGFARGCGQLGESYFFGEGVPKDLIKAKQLLENACDGGYAPECFNVGIMHRQGNATPKNEPLAQARFRRGCDLGYRQACEALELKPSFTK